MGSCSTSSKPVPNADTTGLPPAASDFQPPSQPNGQTPWGQELANVGPDGERTKDSALRLFAIAFGSIPGVDGIDNGEPIRSATVAVRAVYAHWTELTPDQQAAIRARLATPPGVTVIQLQPSAQPAPGAPDLLQLQGSSDTPAIEAAMAAAAQGIRAQIAAKMGADIPGSIDVALAGVDPETYGYANFEYAGPASSYSGCHVTVTELALAGGAPWVLDTLAHEIFHCFEASAYGTKASFAVVPSWIIEGAAEWVGNDIVGVIAPTDLWWDDYLTKPSRSLLTRTYDALGFWAHLQESALSPWGTFPAVFHSADAKAAFLATGASGSDLFLDSWASSTTRDPARGAGWDIDGPGITASASPLKAQQIAGGDNLSFAVPAYTLGLYALFISADVLTVTAVGHARISDAKIDTTAFPASFCVKAGGCDPCPNSAGAVPPAPLGSDPVFAVTGAADGTTGTLTGRSLDDFCKKDDKGHVWVHVDRPASPPALAGRVLELVACGGKIGPWAGEMRLGGLDDGNGFVVDWVSLPMAFTITAEGVPTPVKVTGTVPTPVFDLDVVYNLNIAVNGDTMSITGTGTGDNGLIDISEIIAGASSLPIEVAPTEKCP